MGPRLVVPAERTIDRILIRQGCCGPGPANGPGTRIRFERPGPMQLWGIDIVGGIQLVDTGTGECARRSWSPASTTTPGSA